MEKQTFLMRKKYASQIMKLTEKQKADLIDKIFEYQTTWQFTESDMLVDMLLSIMIDEWKQDDNKYDDICEKRREYWKLWGAKLGNQNARKNWEKQPKQPKGWKNNQNKPINDIWYMINDKWLSNLNISSNEEIEQSSYWNMEINNLIEQLKQLCNDLGIAYDKQKERYFAKFILTAKEFWEFAEKIWQDRVQFALNVLKASVQIKFRKGICAWPMKIYQNYVDVYNETLKQHSKQSKNLIQSF